MNTETEAVEAKSIEVHRGHAVEIFKGVKIIRVTFAEARDLQERLGPKKWCEMQSAASRMEIGKQVFPLLDKDPLGLSCMAFEDGIFITVPRSAA